MRVLKVRNKLRLYFVKLGEQITGFGVITERREAELEDYLMQQAFKGTMMVYPTPAHLCLSRHCAQMPTLSFCLTWPFLCFPEFGVNAFNRYFTVAYCVYCSADAVIATTGNPLV